jgi:hypothetical protein
MTVIDLPFSSTGSQYILFSNGAQLLVFARQVPVSHWLPSLQDFPASAAGNTGILHMAARDKPKRSK